MQINVLIQLLNFEIVEQKSWFKNGGKECCTIYRGPRYIDYRGTLYRGFTVSYFDGFDRL